MRTGRSQTVPGSPTDANTILGYAYIGFGPKKLEALCAHKPKDGPASIPHDNLEEK